MRASVARKTKRHGQDEVGENIYFNVVFDERTFTMEIYGEVSEEMVEKFRLFFNKLTALYKSKPVTKKPKWITIVIDSAGGLSSQGLAIYDTIKTSGVPVKTVALGYVESSAFIFFLAGSARCVHEHSVLMTHANWHDHPGGELTYKELSVPVEHLKVLESLYHKIILENSRLSP